MIKKAQMKCNAPKRTPGHATKSHVVKACAGGEEKIIRFGQHVRRLLGQRNQVEVNL
jgi:hypothetical protein